MGFSFPFGFVFCFSRSSRHALFSTPRVVAHEERVSGFLQGAIRCRYPFLCYTHSEAPRKAATGRDERREVFLSKTRISSSNARENSCAARASLRRDHADAQRVPSRFLRLVPKNDAGDIDGDAATENELTKTKTKTKTKTRGGSKGAALCFFFVSLRAAQKVAPRRSATSWMKTHTNSDSLRFPVIEKTVKPPTHLARGPTRRETFRAKKKSFVFSSRVLPSRDKKRSKRIREPKRHPLRR